MSDFDHNFVPRGSTIRRPEELAASARLRSGEWWDQLKAQRDAGGVSGEGFGFLGYLESSGVPVDLIDMGEQYEIGMCVYEAAWDTGREELTNYCRKLAPVLIAIREACTAPPIQEPSPR